MNSRARLTIEYGDITDFSSLSRVVELTQADVIFHLAAQSYPQTSFTGPSGTLETNIIGTCNLLESVRKFSPSSIVHVCSSSEVFGRVPRELVPISEECRFHPASPYAISKAGTDLLGVFYAEAYGLKTLTTRMFTHTGPRRGDVFAESSFAKQIARIELGLQEPVVKVGNLKSTRTIADVRDAVNAYYLLVTRVSTWGAVFNIGGEKSMSVGEILETLISMSTYEGIDVEVDPERLRPIDADLQIPDTRKFRSATGWAPSISFEQTMEDLLDYWRLKLRSDGDVVQR